MRASFDDAALVEQQLIAGGEEGLTDAQLYRWLAARSWSPARAARDLAAHAAWRAELVGPRGRVLEGDVPNEIAQRKVLVQGPDRRGRGIIILNSGNHYAGSPTSEVTSFIAYYIDAGLATADRSVNPNQKCVGIIDMSGFGMKNFDTAGAIHIARTVQKHYVERLDKMFLFGSNAAFRGIFNLVSPCIDPATRAKFVVLPRDPAEVAAILEREVGLEFVPPAMGGTAKPRRVEEAWAAVEARWQLERQQAQQQADEQQHAATQDAVPAAPE